MYMVTNDTKVLNFFSSAGNIFSGPKTFFRLKNVIPDKNYLIFYLVLDLSRYSVELGLMRLCIFVTCTYPKVQQYTNFHSEQNV